MNGFDLLILLSAALLVLFGAYRGLVRIALGLGGLVVGLILALRWEGAVSRWVRPLVDSDLWAPLLAFVGVVVAVVLAFLVASWTLRHLLRAAHLIWLDRLLGAAAGLVCASLLAGALAVLLASDLPAGSRFLAHSRLAPYTLQISRGVVRLAPSQLRERFQVGLERITAETLEAASGTVS